jgi:hypothetical protein
MGEYLNYILTFILGGGILSVITAKFTRKTAKNDAYSKLESFWEASNAAIRKEFTKRVEELEARITDLETTVCRKPNCKSRVK